MTDALSRALATWSPTKDSSSRTCLYRWGQVYLEGRRRPPDAALAFGNAWDSTSNVVMQVKARTGSDPTPAQAEEVFHESWRTEAAEVESWGDDDREGLDATGRTLARRWTLAVVRRFQPTQTQGSIRVRVEEDWTGEVWYVTGRYDLVGAWSDGAQKGLRVLVDNKTSGRRWSVSEARRSTQAPVYALGMRDLGIEVDRFQWHVGTRTRDPEVQIIERPVPETETAGVIRRFSAQRRLVRAAVEADALTPNRDARTCSRRWCAFWRECEAKFGGTVPE